MYLSHTLQQLHPNASSFVVTQDRTFSLAAFQAEPSNGLKIHEIKDKMSTRIFLPALRRRDGPGVIAEQLVWGEWEVQWGGKEWKVITAEVRTQRLSSAEADLGAHSGSRASTLFGSRISSA